MFKRKGIKKLLAGFLMFVMFFSMSVITDTAKVNAATETVSTISELEDKVNNATEDTTVTLSDSFPTTLTESIDFSYTHGYNIIVDGEGKTLKISEGGEFKHFNVNKNNAKDFTLQNIVLEGNLTWSGDTPNIGAWKAEGGVVTKGSTSGMNYFKNVDFINIKNTALTISVNRSSVTITDCLFKDNASYTSGAIMAESGPQNLIIQTSSFINNGGNYNGGYPGGAIYVKDLPPLQFSPSLVMGGKFTVDNSYFEGNYNRTTTGGVTGGGGAIAMYNARNGSSTKITKSYFKGNIANRNKDTSDLGDGGAIAAIDLPASASFTLDSNTFEKNIAADDGGAVLIQQVATNSVTVTNNTFYGNEAHSLDGKAIPGLSGGAIQIFNNGTSPTANFNNNTFYGNIAKDGSGQTQKGAAIATSSNNVTYTKTNMKSNLFLDNVVGDNRESNYSNVALLNMGTNTDNIGIDNGTAITDTTDTIFGGIVPTLVENNSNIKAGKPGSDHIIPTIPIVPNTGTTGLADNVVTTGATSVDERAYSRSTTKSDVGAVEIGWIKYNENGGEWTLPALTELDGKTYYSGANPDDVYKIGYINEATTVIANTNLTREGYNFLGWDENKDATNPTYEAGDAITINEEKTLYAIWERDRTLPGTVLIVKTDAFVPTRMLKDAEFKIVTMDGTDLRTGLVTGDTGKVTASNIPPGEYKVVETKAPDGYYEDTSEKLIKVNSNTTTTIRLRNEEKASLYSSKTAVGALNISAVDSVESKELLSGVVFDIYNSDGEKVESNKKTDGYGNVTINGLAPDNYSLKMVNAPNGYEVSNNDISVNVNAKTETVVQVKVDEYSGDNLKVANKLDKVKSLVGPLATGNTDLLLTKAYRGEGGHSYYIPGAQYKITNLDTNTVVGTYTTNYNGEISVKGLIAGDYHAEEVFVPNGYEMTDESSKDFTIVNEEYHTIHLLNVYNKVAEPVIPGTGSTTLIKRDRDSQAPLQGVEFQLLDEDLNVVKSGLKTNIYGEIYVYNLEPGLYLWQETKALENYVPDSTYLEVDVVSDSDTPYYLYNTLMRSNITILKQDGDDLTPLEGAEFKVSGTNNGVYREYVVTTKTDGTVVIPNMMPGTYTVEELTPPEGYDPLPNTLTLTVNPGGNTKNDTFVINNSETQYYTVTYNGNGNTDGSAPVDSNSPYEAGSEVEVLGQGDLVRENWEFLGWNTAQDNSGTFYAPTMTFEINENTTLYAMWEENDKYTVTYDGNGNTDGSAPVDSNSPYYTGTEVTVLGQGDLVKDNWTFLGWSEDEDATTATYEATDTFDITKNTTLYAVWQENDKFTVTYNGNTNTDGSAPVDTSSPYYDGTEVTVLGQGDLVKDNWTFIGWSEDESATTATYVEDATFNITKNTTLYAVWQENAKYTVTYNGNGNTDGSAPVDTNSPYYVGTEVTVLGKGDLVKENWTFVGWNTQADGKGTSYTAGGSFEIAEDTTLYAVWVEDGKVAVTYHGNTNTDGSAPVDSNSPYYTGSDVEVLDKGDLVKENWTFVGWNTQADGKGTSYAVGDTISNVTENVNLYAVWQENDKFTVTYDGNGNTDGSAPADTNSPYYTGAEVTVLGKGDLVKDNWTFVGWSEDESATTATYAAGDTFDITKNTTLYAVWQENAKYTVTYNGNGNTDGSAPVDSNSPYYDGTEVTVLGKGDLVKENWTFVGWNTQADGKGTSYAAGGSFEIAEDTTLYAVWVEDGKVAVTYHGNTNTDGSAPVDSNSPYYTGSDVEVLDKGDLVKENWTFVGWNTQADGKGTSYAVGDTISNVTENVNLYAVWQEDAKYTVTYNGNTNTSGAAPTDSTGYYAGNSVTVLGKGTLEKTNWAFLGWSEDKDASTATYAAGDTFNISKNTTLYAIWQKVADDTYVIKYHGNGNTGGSAPVDGNAYTLNDSATVKGKETLVRSGYNFIGWNTQANGLGTSYKEGDTITMDGNKNLYAQWAPSTGPVVKVTVTFNKNASDANNGTITQQTLTQGNSIKDEGKAMGNPTREGYKLIGWCTTNEPCIPVNNGVASLAGTQFKNTTKVNRSLVVYAQWSKEDGEMDTPKTGQDITALLITLGLGLVGIAGYSIVKARHRFE